MRHYEPLNCCLNYDFVLPQASQCAPGLIRTIYKEFDKIPDIATFNREPSISLTDHLMSGLAIFELKCPSLLAFERQKEDTATEKYLRDIYHVN
ncbi:MAG: hypothetical protein WD595_06220 [Waddliaceae bacterium]